MIKRIFYINVFILLGCFSAISQVSNLDNSFLNFWIGDWDLSWTEKGGNIATGRNTIRAIDDGKVIQEQFKALTGLSKGFKGTSVSVFQTKTMTWKQTWVDNQGSYYDFTGDIVNGNPIFQTKITTYNEKKIVFRMVFRDIERDAFTWDWESSDDSGENWKLNWRILYKRKLETSNIIEEQSLKDIFKTFPNVRDFTLSNDGKEAYFTAQSYDESSSKIIRADKVNGLWVLSDLCFSSTIFNDLEPFLSTDNLRLYFASNRTLEQTNKIKDYDIWYVSRIHKDSTWNRPINIGQPINTDHNEFYPSVATNGNLYFTSENSNSKAKDDIYYSKWDKDHFLNPVSLSDSVNTAGYEFNAFIAPDESYLIYSGYKRSDGMGSGDLYISYKQNNGHWGKSKNMGKAINSNRMDYCPFVDTRTNTMYYTSKRSQQLTIEEKQTLQQYIFDVNQYSNGQSRIYKHPLIPRVSNKN